MGFSGSIVGKADNGIPPSRQFPKLVIFYSSSGPSGLYLNGISTSVSHVNDFPPVSCSETQLSLFLDYVGHFN